GLRERHDLTDRRFAGQDGTQAVDAKRDAPVRRRAVLQRVEEEAEARAGLLVADAEQREDASLQRGVVDTEAAARHLAAVEREVVGARTHGAGVRLERVEVFGLRRREGMMHRVPATVFGIELEQREVEHPRERELSWIEQIQLLC